LEQSLPWHVVEMRRAQCADGGAGVERDTHEARLPSTAVTWICLSPRVTPIETVSPA
jgi:hypothetical protein